MPPSQDIRLVGVVRFQATSPPEYAEAPPVRHPTCSGLEAARRPRTQAKFCDIGKCEGRKSSHAELAPEMVAIAKGLRRRKRGNSLRAIAAELAARGYVNVNGRAYSAASVLGA